MKEGSVTFYTDDGRTRENPFKLKEQRFRLDMWNTS